ncbi:MAG: IS1595 family transposase, partial [Patescibacteria group bacterium]|nr:IS1595 family transposase [Patescibacteria group bacterium]
MIKRSKLSSYQLKKVITHFVIDINATKTSLLLGVNRNTVNRFYHILRRVICQEQMQLFEEKLHKTTVE